MNRGKPIPRDVGSAVGLDEGNRWCTCCGRELRDTVAWLELDQRSNTYHDDKGVPADRSQGWFPFGLTCAKNKLAEHYRKVPSSDQGEMK